jgi:hypothetical protein
MELFSEIQKKLILIQIGNGISVCKEDSYVDVYRNGAFLFRENIDSREISPEFRMFVISLVTKYKVTKIKLAQCFNISRESVNTWIKSFEQYGIQGLVNSTKPGGKGRPMGNKARIIEQKRAEKQAEQQQIENIIQLDLFEIKRPVIEDIIEPEMPFSQVSPKTENRYAGQIINQILLVSKWSWYWWIIGVFGRKYKIFQVFLLMVGKNIRSIEQLKNIRQYDAGKILGLNKLPSLPGIWKWFYEVAKQCKSEKLKETFLGWQLKMSLVGTTFWFTDGHVLPYSGLQRLRKMFNTKRRLAEPGRSNLVTTDWTGRIVDFEIQEGNGNLRARILELHNKWGKQFELPPVQVFDREGQGADFYYSLVSEQCPFVSWEKNVDTKKLYAFDKSEFNLEFIFNDTTYKYFEVQKKLTTQTIEKDNSKIDFSLRRFYVLNTKTDKRTSVLAYNGVRVIESQDCIIAILNRWGASENTFKYLNNRHPLHYQPGFKYNESTNQMIDNPEVKKIEKEIEKIKNELQKIYKAISHSEQKNTKKGEARKNDIYTQLKAEITEKEQQISKLQVEKKQHSERVDVSGLENYGSFKTIDNEAKTLFDFVLAANWNARKEGIEILEKFYYNQNDIVDLFYAITNCQGSIEVSGTQIKVILEPLEQSGRRVAQIDFCRYLTNLMVCTPSKKYFVVEVAKR